MPTIRSLRRRIAPVLLAGLFVVAVAACSGSSGSSDVSAPTTTDRAARRSTSTTTSTTTPAEWKAADVPADPSSGCGTEADVDTVGKEAPGDVEQTFTSGGVERTYRLGVPTGYDPDVATPLVFNLHGSGSDAIQQAVYSDAARVGSERDTIVVTPEAMKNNWQLSGTGADDDFLLGLLDDVESRYCVDQNRVHLMGMSLGSWKTAITACSHPDRFVSIALVTVEVYPGTCEPMAVVAFHGTADLVVPYGEGSDPGVVVTGPNAGLPGAVGNIDNWAESGGCDPEPTITAIGGDVSLRRFHDCDTGVGVELYTVEGGGHTWPGSAIAISGPKLTTQTIDATELAFDWFEAHPRR